MVGQTKNFKKATSCEVNPRSMKTTTKPKQPLRSCVISVFSLVFLNVCSQAQQTSSLPESWPNWAYGYLEPLMEGDQIAPPCPVDAKPLDCAYRSSSVTDDGVKFSLPETSLSFTASEADYDYGPADWYPDDHPLMPDIVQKGRQEEKIRACSLCHYPNGQGKMENGHVAGLPYGYILDQLEIFSKGDRRSADPRKANTNEMMMIAKSMTDEEKQIVARYFSSINFKPLVNVIEATKAPQVRMTTNGLMLPIEDMPFVPLGSRIIEVPTNPQRTEIMRDPRGMFTSYVPIGSLEKGKLLVETNNEKTIQCGICHGPNQTGLADIPSIAGRTASYTMRQLWDIKQGTRKSPVMIPIISNLDIDDLLNISAYLASLPP